MPPGNGKPNSFVEWMAGQNMPKKKTKGLSLRPLLSASIDVVTDDNNQRDYVAVGFPHQNSPLRRFDHGQSSKKVAFNSSSMRHSVDALSMLADSSGGEFLSGDDSEDHAAPSQAVVKRRKSSFKQGKEKNTVDADTSEGETGHGGYGLSPHPNCDCLLCAAGRSLMRELGKGGASRAYVANIGKTGRAPKGVDGEVTAGETTTAGETDSEPQPKGKGKKGKGGGGQSNQQSQETKDEAKNNENEKKKNGNENKNGDHENKKDGGNNKKGDQGNQNNKQETKGNPSKGNTPLPYRGSPNSRIILPVRQQTVHIEHAIEDTAKDHPPNAYMDFNRDVCRMYHGSEWGTHRKPHPSGNSAVPPPTPSQNMASMYQVGPYIHGMPPMPPMYPPQVLPQPAYTQMAYPHHMYQPAYIHPAQHQSKTRETAQAPIYPTMYAPQLHPSYGVYPPHSQPGGSYPPPGVMWGVPPPVNPSSPVAGPAAPFAALSPKAAATGHAGLSGMGLSGLGPAPSGLSGLPNTPGGPPPTLAQPADAIKATLAKASEEAEKHREEQKKKYPNGIPGVSGSSKGKTPTPSVKEPSKPPTENEGSGDGNSGGINGYNWDDKNSNGGDKSNNDNNNNNSGENKADEWDTPATDWNVGNAETTGDAWNNPAVPRYDASQSAGDPDPGCDNPAGHMPGSWDTWDNLQNGSRPGSPQGTADSGYFTVDPVPAEQNPSAWNEATTSMLSSIGWCYRSTLSAAKQTIFGGSLGNTADDNGETKDEWNDPTVEPANGAAQGGWDDPTTSQPDTW